MLDSLFPPASYTPRQPVPHTTIMAHHHRKYKYTTRSSSTPRPRMNVCNVVYTPHPTADDLLVRSPCKIPVERPGFRCPAHEAEYRESAREYTFWMEQGNALEDLFTLSPQSVNAFCDIEEVQMRWFAVKEAVLMFSSEATKRMVHWYRFYKDQDPSSLHGAELFIHIPLLKRKVEWLEGMEEKLRDHLAKLCKAKAKAQRLGLTLLPTLSRDRWLSFWYLRVCAYTGTPIFTNFMVLLMHKWADRKAFESIQQCKRRMDRSIAILRFSIDGWLSP